MPKVQPYPPLPRHLLCQLGRLLLPQLRLQAARIDLQAGKISEQTPSKIAFTIDGQDFAINIGGTYNIYNALAAFACAREFDVSGEEIAQAFAKNKRIFGRQELINYQGKEINIILVKTQSA